MARVFMAAYTNYRRDPRVRREAEALVPEHDVMFMARRQPGEPHAETISGVRVIKTVALPRKPDSFMAYMVDYVLFLIALTVHLTLHPSRYQLIHINNMPDFLVLAAWLPKLCGVPIIHDIHDLMPELYLEKFNVTERHWAIRIVRLQERLAAGMADAVLTVEERLRDILDARGIIRQKTTVLLNLPDEGIFKPGENKEKAADAPFTMVYHGTLARRLGLDVALEAVARLKPRIPNIQFRIIGAGEERERLLRLRDSFGLQDNVSFSEGFVPVETIPEVISDADIGVVPLRPSPGTDIMLPTKLLEYVQMGIPCVAPKTGTIQRYFDDSMVRFFAAGNAQSMADAIFDLYADPEAREQLATNACNGFVSRYRWSEHKRVYIGLVNGLLARRAGGKRGARSTDLPSESLGETVVHDAPPSRNRP